MPDLLRTIAGDARGIARVFGPGVAARWLLAAATRAPTCWRERTMRAADRALGEGPFDARLRSARARLVGPDVISGAREIWVRDVYLGGGFLHIPPDGVVVDLGCNRGIFTLLALGHGDGVRVTSVEADRDNLVLLDRSLQANDWTDRVTVVNAFVGGVTDFQATLRDRAPDQAAVPWLTGDELVDRLGTDRIDFLKCDIEGSEYDLFAGPSRLLEVTRRLAIELHREAGRPEAFIEDLEAQGFETTVSRASANDIIVLARRPDAA
ncbi:MAG: FkbM family methyltransferase [Phycisphaerales bacterium]|nr:FkbM family methyltransferase [Phycisphaerales bacterium]